MWHLGFDGEHGGTGLTGPEVKQLEVFFSLYESMKAGAKFRNQMAKRGVEEQESTGPGLHVLRGQGKLLPKAERGGWLGTRQLFEVVTKSSSRAVLCWQSFSCAGRTRGSMGCLVHRARFQGFWGCLLFCGLEGRKVTVSMYHGPGLLTGRFLSLLSINISRCRSSLGVSVLCSHRLAINVLLCG